MIKGKNILCFGSENWSYPGFQQTIMRKLSFANRIIFVNPLGSRKVTMRWSQLNFYLKRLKMIGAKKFAPTSNITVCSPWIVPLVYNRAITKLNRHIIRVQFNKLLSNQNFKPYILWIGTPAAAFCMDMFDPEFIVYHAVDRYSQFSFVDKNKICAYEKKVAQKADVILCTSDAIRNDLSGYNKSAFTVTHAVDFDHFNSALESGVIPTDLKTISKPIIGYFGGLSERLNYSLLKKIALRYTNANIVLIGKKLHDLGYIENLPNVHILGFRDYDSLPSYLKHFNVCLIPYLVNELMLGVDPIKLREYLCQGKPVVSTKLPEAEKLKPLLFLGENEEDFVEKVGYALKENGSSLKKDRIRLARKCDWPNKTEEISKILTQAFQRKITRPC
ncbi:MAG: glycosyltransferase family 1 protein [Desulfobacteraceae bacterium]|nr:glycosyltransferase family 1 protein [Desulfobacteraceae bacterium]